MNPPENGLAAHCPTQAAPSLATRGDHSTLTGDRELGSLSSGESVDARTSYIGGNRWPASVADGPKCEGLKSERVDRLGDRL